jgi:hypothetical protein
LVGAIKLHRQECLCHGRFGGGYAARLSYGHPMGCPGVGPADGERGSGVASYFSPRKITPWYAFQCVYACVRVGAQPPAIDRQTGGIRGRIGEVAGVIMDARLWPDEPQSKVNCA